METKSRYTFKKNEKLKSRKTIEQLFKEGNSFSIFPFRILWCFNEHATDVLQVGLTAGSKHFKKAVDRNRVKRLMREAYRLQKNELHEVLTRKPAGPIHQGPAGGKKYLAVFIIYTGKELPDYDTVFKKTGLVIKRLIKIVNEDPAANI